MSDINYLAVIVAAVVAFIISSVWYVVFGNAMAKLSGDKADIAKPPAWKMLAEFVRSLVITFVLAYFIVQLDIVGWMDAVWLGALVWLGFPAMILTGAVLWENEPWKLAVIHTGDWLVKLLAIVVILGVWR